MKSPYLSDLSRPTRDMYEAAKKVRENAYAPYSGYHVGAAVLDENNNIHVGCNNKNAILIVGHAETSAINAMIAAGSREIKAVVCITKDGGTCCGYCRQLIWEHCQNNGDVPIYCFNTNGDCMQFTIGELLPFAFKLEQKKTEENAWTR